MSSLPRLSINNNLGELEEEKDASEGVTSPAPLPQRSPPTPNSGSLRKPSMAFGKAAPDSPLGGLSFPSITGGAAISNSHVHNYHYHLYQTTINDASGEGGDKKGEDADEKDDGEDEELAELMELFPDGIPEELLMDDGTGVPQEVVDEDGNVITVIRPRQKPIKNIFGMHDLSQKEVDGLSFMGRMYRFLHDPSSTWYARIWSVVMVTAIICSSVMILLQSMPSLTFLDSINGITSQVEFYSVILFTADYLFKLFSVHSYADSILSKPLPYNVLWRFLIQPLNLLDLVSVVPFWVQYVLGDGATSTNSVSLVFRIVRIMRIIRLLKVAQYSRSIDIFFRVLIQAWDALLLLLFFVGFGSITFGTLLFLTEGGTKVDYIDPSTNETSFKFLRVNGLATGLEETPFTSIPMSFWYVVTTLTTVGYGDMIPTSVIGKMIGGGCMLSGVLFISTPLVIFGTHFQNEFTKELERVAFLNRRQEKIRKKQEAKDKADKEAARQAEEDRIAAGGGETDALGASMGLEGAEGAPGGASTGGHDPASPQLPGQVPPSPSGQDGMPSPMSPSAGRTSSFQRGAMRGSIMVRTGTFGRGSVMPLGGSLGLGGGGDVSIRVNDSPGGKMRGSIMPGGASLLGGGSGGNFLAPMQLAGGSNCVCPCSCGARGNAAAGQMPGENVIGGVRRSIITKQAGGRMSMVGGGPSISNPTAADNLAVAKGMQLAAQILPPQNEAERAAARMAGAAASTFSSNLSSAHILEMQAQLDSLRTMVSQLGGLLIAGGAPAPAIANAMMASLVPADKETKEERRARKSIKATGLSMADSALPEPASPGPKARTSITGAGAQPSSGKLGKPATSSPVKPAGASPVLGGTTGSSPTLPAATAPATGKLKRASTSVGGAGAQSAFALPPAATTTSAIPSGTPGVEMTPLSPSGIATSVETPQASPVAMQPLPASPTAAPAAAPAAASAAAAAPAGPVALTIDQIIPSRPVRTFPPAPADESAIDMTIRMLDSLIDAPKATEKLLSKPPFRFIHDIVTNMVRQLAFPENYFEAGELDPSTLMAIQPKLDFLEKLIDLLSIMNQVDLSHISAKKIVAGMEPEKTQEMLQHLCRAAASGISVDQVTAMMV